MIGLYGDRVGDVIYGMAAGYIARLDPTEDLEAVRFIRGAISVTDDAGLVGGAVGPVLLGKYADRIGHLKTATLCSLTALVLVYLLSVYDSANLLLTFHLFFPALASFALPTLLQSHLIKVTEKYERDLVVGIFFTVNFGFSSMWSGVVGYIIDLYSSFTPAFILMGTLGLMAFAVLADQMRKYKRIIE